MGTKGRASERTLSLRDRDILLLKTERGRYSGGIPVFLPLLSRASFLLWEADETGLYISQKQNAEKREDLLANETLNETCEVEVSCLASRPVAYQLRETTRSVVPMFVTVTVTVTRAEREGTNGCKEVRCGVALPRQIRSASLTYGVGCDWEAGVGAWCFMAFLSGSRGLLED